MAGSGPSIPLIARKSSGLRGEAPIPGDKSVSHRALIFGAMAIGKTRITGLLEGEDVLDTAKAMRALGATVVRKGLGEWEVDGVGTGGFCEPEDVLDHGNSGTGVRLVMGAVATHGFNTTFTGDASLRKRPMNRILQPMALFGASSVGRSEGRLPLTLIGAKEPVPVEYRLPVPSAQVKSAVLLAGLNTPGETCVIEDEATRDHTERMLRGFGAVVEVDERAQGRFIRLQGQPELKGQEIQVGRDPSSAAFPVVAALLVEGSHLQVPGIGLNPTRAGLYETLQEMGADLTLQNEREEGGEPVADLIVRFSALKGVEVPPERAASMIDEYPILSVAAAFAQGPTVMRGVKELRVKETDRIAAMATGLRACGVEVEETEDSMTVFGRGADGVRGGALVSSELDHRIAMSFAVLGLAAQEPVTIDDAGPIATSFPNFLPLMQGLGADLVLDEDPGLGAGHE
ncbi:MAG: 3-phosphoshikimate 1-carboxyvinyltransferase [Neomegalonema sp.]|nr:3-phosphoshikimate 1-carboxyvinyltransferase [Neomegalonema sp.]